MSKETQRLFFWKFNLWLFFLLACLTTAAWSTTWYVDSTAPNQKGQWTADTVIDVGDRMVCTLGYATTAAKGFIYECTASADDKKTHATTEPTWPTTPGNTVVDDQVTWTCRLPDDWNDATPYLYYLVGFTGTGPVAGETFYIASDHNETYNGSINNFTFPGTIASPNYIYNIDTGTGLPTTVSRGRIFQDSSSYNITLYGNFYCYGLEFESDGNIILLNYPATEVFEQCYFEFNSASRYFRYGASGGAGYTGCVQLNNCTVDFGAVSNYFNPIGTSHTFLWRGGSLVAGAGITGKLFDGASYPTVVDIQDVDLSAMAGGAILDAGDNGTYFFNLSRCILHGDTTPTASTWEVPYQGYVQFNACGLGDNDYANIDYMKESYEGTVWEETNCVRSSGATTPASTAFSWKMTSSSGTAWASQVALISPPVIAWNTSTTAGTTCTVECIYDSATNLEIDEVWMELEYPINATDSLGAIDTDSKATDPLNGSSTDATSSTATWSGTTYDGMANPNKFKLVSTITAGKAGPITARVYLAKASTTIYVDPKITIAAP